MYQEQSTDLENLEKKFRKYLLFIIFCTIIFPFAIKHEGKEAYYGIEKQTIYLPNNIEYKVHLPKNSQINFDFNGKHYISKCNKQLCKAEFDQELFIGNNVEYLTLISNNITKGIIIRGNFKKKSDNSIYKIELSQKEIDKAINKYRMDIWLLRLALLMNFFGVMAFIGYLLIWLRIIITRK